MAIALYWSRFRPGLSQIFRVVGYGYCSILVQIQARSKSDI